MIAVDDVRVTGTHENALDACLSEAGARRVDHLYVLDAFAVRNDPRTESAINRASVRDVEGLLMMAAHLAFVPNARYAKTVVLLADSDRRQFLREAPADVLSWVRDAVLADGLAQVPAYADGASAYLSEVALLAAA